MKSTDSLVPDDFDLDAARSARTTTSEDVRDRCPECESLKIHSKGERNGKSRQYETDHYCSNCGEHFDEPLEAETNA